MAYTPSADKVGGNLFEGQVNDGNRNAMSYGNNILTQDATSSPNQSPLTVNTTATLKVPQNAVSVTIVSTTNAVQVSEDSTQTSYFTLPAGVPWTFDVARQQYVYLKTSGSTVVNFYFTTV